MMFTGVSTPSASNVTVTPIPTLIALLFSSGVPRCCVHAENAQALRDRHGVSLPRDKMLKGSALNARSTEGGAHPNTREAE